MKNNKIEDNQTLFDEKTAAAILSVSYDTLRKRIRPRRLIAHVRIANSVRYTMKDLNAYIAKCRVKAVS